MMEGTFRRLMMRAGGSQLSDAAAFLASYGPFGMVMDFTDASISINDVTDVLDYNSQGTISSTTGLPLGPGSKLTYTAPSAKLTEQADGYLGFQAHNLYLNSAAPANQSITVISGATYAITITGSVSVTASGAATGTWTDGTNTFTAATTTLTLGSTSGSGTVHVRRTPSVSTYVATTGAIVYDIPYVYSSGVKTGVLVEPAATNLATANTTASGYGGTQAAASNVTTATPISDLTTLIGLTDNVNNANHGLYNNAVNTASATDYAISAIVKAGARNYAGIGISVDSNNYICAVFDLSTGTFGQTSVGGTSGTIAGSGTAYGIVPLANGCYRIWIAGKVTGVGTPHVWAANAATGNSFGSQGGPTYAGNTTVAIYTTAIQVETGTVATSPIITYGAAVTRAADNSLKVAVANFPVGGTAHTLYMELQRPEKDVTATFVTLQGTSTDFIQLIDDSASLRGVVRTVADGVTATLALATENALNTPFKIAISADTTADGVHDGGSVVSDAACICATTFATLDIGHASLTRPMLVKAIAYLPARKSGAELQGMTTP